MQELGGRVAVVTGGAGGIGAALARAFVDEGMRVVIADVQGAAVDAAVTELRTRAGDDGRVVGVVTDVSDAASVEALADATWDAFGACHVLCNNAGVGAPSSAPWRTTVNDWRWVHGVNVMGVVHGVLAFVPRMIEAGEEGHVVNTSSSDGGVEPLPTASVYAASKAAVTSYTECLASQLLSEGTNLRASVFYPAGGLLRTGLWESERTRPAELTRERPRDTEPMTVAKLEAMAEKGGFELGWQDLDELASLVVDGIRSEQFVITIGADEMSATLHDRADAFAAGALPKHKSIPGA
jgi:NAD(P)-dependent dehydrogenase (short-subunit alcohol dehydrogenase family)